MTIAGQPTDPQAAKPTEIKPDVNATPREKVVLAVILVAFTVLLLFSIFKLFTWIESPATGVAEVTWQNDKHLPVKPGPTAFYYDRKANLIRYRGLITDDSKKMILGLVDGDDPDYREAVNELAFNSYSATQGMFRWILVLAGMGGIVGVQIRSFNDFIGNACYKKSLDIGNWWAWYALRPPLGFLLGMLVVAFIKSDLLVTTHRGDETSLWWLGLAAIAGFGVSDVVGRLRLLSKTLFGIEKSG